MQIACPWCSHPLVIEDAKVPARRFLARCPKCRGGIQLPGSDEKGAAAARHGPPPAGATQSGKASAQPAESARSSRPASAATPVTGSTIANGDSGRRALVALEDAHWASTMASLLGQQGYGVESLNPWEEKVQHLHQGEYELVVTARSGPVIDDGKTLHSRMDRLSPEARRRTFLMLVGEEFRTGDGKQAFVNAADLVVHPSGLGEVGTLLPLHMEQRARIYRAFQDAEKRRDGHR